MSKTVSNLGEDLREALNRLGVLPPGIEVASVAVLSGSDRIKARRKRATAALDRNLSAGDSLFITLQAATPEPAPVADSSGKQRRDLIQALAEAERTPGHAFVSLKWFRDTFLPAHADWANTPEVRDRVLRRAIEAGWINVQRIPNPKHPQFPTSAIAPNRVNAEVQHILGLQPGRWGFTPIKMPGEPLSETVRRMRDEGY